jgi:hypothetical protein
MSKKNPMSDFHGIFPRLSHGTKFSPVLYGTKPLLGFAIGPTILGGRSDRARHANDLFESELERP